MKYLLLPLVLLTGCATQGDLDILDSKIAALESSNTKLALAINECDSKVAHIDAKVKQCDLHCKKLESKLDRVFKKSQQK